MIEPEWREAMWRCERWLDHRRPTSAADVLQAAAAAPEAKIARVRARLAVDRRHQNRGLGATRVRDAQGAGTPSSELFVADLRERPYC
jgi:hypothetical protein